MSICKGLYMRKSLTKKWLNKNGIFKNSSYIINAIKRRFRNFPGGAVVKNLPANAGDMGLSPGPGRSHMLGSN